MRLGRTWLVVWILIAACEAPQPLRGDDALAALEAESGARWRAVFDRRLATATVVARVGDAGGRQPRVIADPAAAARALVAGHEGLFGAAAAGELIVRDVAPDGLGGTRVRFEARVAGLPLEAGDVTVVVDAAGAVRAVAGRAPRRAELAATPAIPADEAVAAALAWVGSAAPDVALALEAPPELVATLVGDEARPAWRVRVAGDGTANPARVVRRELLVDAAEGAILIEREGLWSGRAQGSGIGVDGTRRALDVWRERDGTYALRDLTRAPAGIRTYTAGGRERLPGRAVRSADPHRWDEEGPAAGAAVDAHAWAAAVYDYLADVHGRPSLDGRDGGVRLVVHFGDGYANAFWDGRHAVFGDGDGEIGPFAGAVDIVAHELFHAVTEHESGLVYAGESGALSESLSDVFATFVEMRADGGDWTIGEDAMDPPLRDLADPWASGLPSHMSEYVHLPLRPETDMGGVHVNSTIPSHAAYLVAVGGRHRRSGVRVNGIGVARTRRIWYRAATVYLGPAAGFSEFAVATLAAAEDLHGPGSQPVAAVEAAWRAVGVWDGW